MSDPLRLIDEGASDFERQLLSAWGHELAPDHARRRALALAGAGAATTLTAASTARAAASVAPKASLVLTLTKWLGVGMVAGLATGGVAVHYAAPLPSPPRNVVSQTAAPMVPRHVLTANSRRAVATGPLQHAARAPAVALPSRHEAPASPRPVGTNVAAFESPHGSLGPETAALDRARAALQSGQLAQALALVADYQRRFPDGMLEQEAAVLRIDALDKQGRRAEAIREARRFLAVHPDSPHAERLERLTAGKTNP